MFLLRGRCTKVLRHDPSKIRDGYFRLLNFGMPGFCPFEGVVARISSLGQQPHLALDGHIAAAGKNVMIRATLDSRVLQVSVADVFAEPGDADRWIFLAFDISIMCIPEQRDVRRAGLFEDLARRGRIGEVAVRFEQNRDVLWTGILAEFAEAGRNMLERRPARADQLVAENAYIGSADLRGKVNESPRVGKLLLVLPRIDIVQVGRTAHAGDAQPARGNLFLGLLDAGRSKFGTGGQIHGPHEPAKLDGGKAVLLREVENLEPVPGRAAERRKPDRQAFAGSAQVGWQRRQSHDQALKKLPPSYVRRQHTCARNSAIRILEPPTIDSLRSPASRHPRAEFLR